MGPARFLAAVAVGCVLLCTVEGAALRRSRRSGRGDGELDDKELEREAAAFASEPTPSELAKVDVAPPAAEAAEKPAEKKGPKLGKPGWRKSVKVLSKEVADAAQQLRDADAESLQLRDEYRQKRKEGIDEDEIARAKRVADESRTAVEQQRLRYHLRTGQLADYLQPHPSVPEHEWPGSTEDPLWSTAMQLVRTATYDGTWIQNEKVDGFEPYEDPKHTYQGDEFWGKWKPGPENPSPSKMMAKLA